MVSELEENPNEKNIRRTKLPNIVEGSEEPISFDQDIRFASEKPPTGKRQENAADFIITMQSSSCVLDAEGEDTGNRSKSNRITQVQFP